MRPALFITLFALTACSSDKSPGPPTASPPIEIGSDNPAGQAPQTPSTPAFSLMRFRDAETGTVWDLRGEAVTGELAGTRLQPLPAYSAYWFAWASFWPNTAVWPQGGNGRYTSDNFAQLPSDDFVPDLPRDAIPPLDDPDRGLGTAVFIAAELAYFLSDDDIVIGVEVEGDARAYPIKILNFHEIVNPSIGGRRRSVTYCPLTASGLLFDADTIEFGNTGGLYNNNMVMYDRKSESFWSQMRFSAILGSRAGERIDVLPVFQGTWAAWQAMQPNTQVLTPDTGYSGRNYGSDIYSLRGYTVSTDVWFPQRAAIDPRHHPKDPVLGLVGQSSTQAYPFSTMGRADIVVNDTFEGEPIAVVYQPSARAALAFSRRVNDRVLQFEVVK